LDGRPYSYQGLCWHTLVKDCSGIEPEFEITVNFEPRLGDDRTRVVAANITVGGEHVTADRNGVVTRSPVGGTLITVEYGVDHNVLLSFNTASGATFECHWNPRTHAFSVDVTGSGYHGTLCGLLGNADGNGQNDFQKPDFTVVLDAVEFGKSWKVLGIDCD
jgi:hypothetical protein